MSRHSKNTNTMDNTKHSLHNENERCIDGVRFNTEKKEIVSCNIIEVEAGTTGYCGGDTGHGGRTLFRLTNKASTDMRISFHTNYSPYGKIEIGDLQLQGIHGTAGFDLEADEIQIYFGGDCELETFIEALEFAIETLKKQSAKK
jgi:hypothetical protein